MLEDRVSPNVVSSAPPRLAPTRSEWELLLDQLQGIQAWTRGHSAPELRLAVAMTREERLDLARGQEVVERQRQALRDWTAHQLRESDHVLRSVAALRAVVVHRNAWFKDKLATGLRAGGVTVVADLDNGADAVGVIVAEQPDLVVVEDKLAMLSGLEVTREVRRYAPNAVVVAQVANDWEIGPFVEAGVAAAYPRRFPPADIAADLRTLLNA